MSTCQGCGGLIGRDCYNPTECLAITQDMAARYQGEANEAEELRCIIQECVGEISMHMYWAYDGNPRTLVSWCKSLASDAMRRLIEDAATEEKP